MANSHHSRFAGFTIGANPSISERIRDGTATHLAAEQLGQRQWHKPICDERRRIFRRREISVSHGTKWKALISRYIGAMPLSGDTPCAAEQSISSDPPPKRLVSKAMIRKVGAAASDIQTAAPATGWACWSSLRFIGSTLRKQIQW
jgi:hypothetical protein